MAPSPHTDPSCSLQLLPSCRYQLLLLLSASQPFLIPQSHFVVFADGDERWYKLPDMEWAPVNPLEGARAVGHRALIRGPSGHWGLFEVTDYHGPSGHHTVERMGGAHFVPAGAEPTEDMGPIGRAMRRLQPGQSPQRFRMRLCTVHLLWVPSPGVLPPAHLAAGRGTGLPDPPLQASPLHVAAGRRAVQAGGHGLGGAVGGRDSATATEGDGADGDATRSGLPVAGRFHGWRIWALTSSGDLAPGTLTLAAEPAIDQAGPGLTPEDSGNLSASGSVGHGSDAASDATSDRGSDPLVDVVLDAGGSATLRLCQVTFVWRADDVMRTSLGRYYEGGEVGGAMHGDRTRSGSAEDDELLIAALVPAVVSSQAAGDSADRVSTVSAASDVDRATTRAGLVNFGNSCYLNAVLQVRRRDAAVTGA